VQRCRALRTAQRKQEEGLTALRNELAPVLKAPGAVSWFGRRLL